MILFNPFIQKVIRKNNAHLGFSLSEIIIGLILVGVVSLFVVPAILRSTQGDTSKIALGLKSDLAKSFTLSNINDGLIQKSSSPSAALVNSLKLIPYDASSEDPNHANCSVLGSTCYSSPNTGLIVQLSDAWDAQNKAQVNIYDKSGNYVSNLLLNRGNGVQDNTQLAVVQPITDASPAGEPVNTNSAVSSTPSTTTVSAPTIKSLTGTINVTDPNGTFLTASVWNSTNNTGACGTPGLNGGPANVFGNIDFNANCTYAAYAAGYNANYVTVNNITSNFTKSIKLYPVIATTINVTDEAGNPLTATVWNSTKNTGSCGTPDANNPNLFTNVGYNVSCGYYASADGYITGNVKLSNIKASQVATIALKRIKYKITIKVNAGNKSEADATIWNSTNNTGMCGTPGLNGSPANVFSNVDYNANCAYAAHVDGFNDNYVVINGIKGSYTKTITLTPITYNVTVNAVDASGNSIPGAKVYASSGTGCGKASGSATGSIFKGVTYSNSNCVYKATATEYDTAYSSATSFSSDSTVNIPLSPTQHTVTFQFHDVDSPIWNSTIYMTSFMDTISCDNVGTAYYNNYNFTDRLRTCSVAFTNIYDGAGTRYFQKSPGYITFSTNSNIVTIPVKKIQKLGMVTTWVDVQSTNVPGVTGWNSYALAIKEKNYTWDISQSYRDVIGSGTGQDDNTVFDSITNVYNRISQQAVLIYPGGGTSNVSLSSFLANTQLNWDGGRKSFADICSADFYNNCGRYSDINAFFYGQATGGASWASKQYINSSGDWDSIWGNASFKYQGSGNRPSDFDILYTDPNGDVYNVTALFFSPIKINLNGKNAVVTDAGSFKFDVDGFHSSVRPVMQTTGGLNSDEAWLVLDRGHTGIYKNDIVDGDAVFGDHLGMFKNGYEDLTYTFPSYIQKDKSTGRSYIELTPEPWWVGLWHSLQKLFGVNVTPNPYADLKLLTSGNHIIDAHNVLKRIDVSYRDVNEYSQKASTAIFQRADVYYTNGKKASGADLWFKPQFKLTKHNQGK